MLLALAGARQCSEVHHLDVSSLRCSANIVTFSLVGLVKKQRLGQPAKMYSFPCPPQDPVLCVASTVQKYMKQTASLRPSADQSSGGSLLLVLLRRTTQYRQLLLVNGYMR